MQTLPGTNTPISLLNLSPASNPIYYVDNTGGLAYGTSIQYDGTSVILTASAQLQCGEQYHIKLGISNVGDQALDSGVFLEAESFTSNQIVVETASTFTGSFTDTLLAEGCTTATLNFIRPSASDTIADTLALIIGGDIDINADLVGFNDTIFFPVGVDTVSLLIDPINDFTAEPIEYIEIGFYSVTICGDSLYDSLLLYVTDRYDLTWDLIDTLVSDCSLESVEILNLEGSIPIYQFDWSHGETLNPAPLPIHNLGADTTYFVTITDGCGNLFYDSVVHSYQGNVILWDLVDTVYTSCLPSVDPVEVLNLSGSPTYTFDWNYGGNTNPSDLPAHDLGNDTTYFVTISDACGNEFYDSVVHVFIPPTLTWDLADTIYSFCLSNVDSVEILNFAGSIPNYTTQWSFGGTSNPEELPSTNGLNDTTTYYVDITDGCGYVYSDSVTYVMNQTLVIDSVTSIESSFVQPPNCLPSGIVQGYVSGQTEVLGLTNYNWIGPGTTGPYNINGSSMADVPPGWYYFTVTDDVCSLNDSVEVEVLQPPIANFTADPISGCSPLSVNFSNSSQNTVTYDWDFGNGNVLNGTDASSQNQVFNNTSIVTLTAYDQNNCFGQVSINIDIVPCGCTDPSALNYDALAFVEDGSCIYPVPTVIAPNVFTPNSDGQNDIFFFETLYAVSIDIVITNRWGNVVYDKTVDLTTFPQAGWNGVTNLGIDATEGTYFYRYEATGINGDKVDGHGFLQLVRD